MLQSNNAILFYRASGKYGFLSNLYKKKIKMNEMEFPTVEHAYQFKKFREEAVAEWVMNAPAPHLVAIVAHGLFAWDIIPDWSKIKVDHMEDCVRAKFTQHPDLAQQLINTGKKILIEQSTMDNFWGCGKKGTGKNMLGKILMKVRIELEGNRK